jgi:hypothetical protein
MTVRVDEPLGIPRVLSLPLVSLGADMLTFERWAPDRAPEGADALLFEVATKLFDEVLQGLFVVVYNAHDCHPFGSAPNVEGVMVGDARCADGPDCGLVEDHSADVFIAQWPFAHVVAVVSDVNFTCAHVILLYGLFDSGLSGEKGEGATLRLGLICGAFGDLFEGFTQLFDCVLMDTRASPEVIAISQYAPPSVFALIPEDVMGAVTSFPCDRCGTRVGQQFFFRAWFLHVILLGLYAPHYVGKRWQGFQPAYDF